MKNTTKYILIFLGVITVGIVIYFGYRYFILEREDREVKKPEVKQFMDETGADVSYDFNVFTNEGGVFDQDEIVGKVGKVDVLGRTINLCVWGQIGGSEDFGEYGSLENVLDYCKEVWQERLIWLQEYMNDDLIISQESNEEIKRLILLADEAEQESIYSNVSTIDFEYVSMWYRNISDPPMGVDAAREIVRVKMESIREDLITGRLSDMPAARDRILADNEQKEIDIAFEQNAYFKGESIISGELDKYFDGDIIDVIENLSVGEYSEVLETTEIIGGAEGTGRLFMIVRINSIEGKEFEDIDVKLQNLNSKYPAEWEF